MLANLCTDAKLFLEVNHAGGQRGLGSLDF
jgi:hypothetical protein